ncbi:putative sterol delta 5,6-desaturase [Piedraia hortae CBS 480.64]|uniref:Putative sterol delta 5,6-desaturase n=1 Tax=Piedraia hortae CBS 480.64 TaxID=1314780 RepID=A0A6A7C4T3_9PEZI|nr:putative sterol delta 5,6-desaturase [Piedraia hortae CBS 480.64]
MDIVLEVCDTFFLDKLYARLLPATTFAPVLSASKGEHINATVTQEVALGSLGRSAWQYKPATDYFYFPPSEYAWMSRWDRDNIVRQFLSLYILTIIMANILYFTASTLSYLFVFDHDTFKHPKYLKNQIRLEIKQATTSMPMMTALTVPWFIAECRGWSFMYNDVANAGFAHPFLTVFGKAYNWIQFPLFILFTDFCIYWIHRGLHHPIVYKHLHKPHHKWIMPTPYASIAFHPLDGYAQSLPYHVFPFLFPLHKFAYILLFTFIQIWTVIIHDGEYVANSPVINGAACHTMHHLYFNYNYGQFTTLWDRLGGSYRKPNMELFYKETKMSAAEWARQQKEMERVVLEVEGEDDRSYEGKKAQ